MIVPENPRAFRVGILLMAGLIVGALSAERAAAQDPVPLGEIQGHVVDLVQGEPVVTAGVVLLNEGGEVVARRTTDDRGAFEFLGLPAGSYSFRIERLGYAEEPVEQEVELAESERLAVILQIAAEAIELNPIRVEVPRTGRARGREVFAQRREEKDGVFLTRAEILAQDRAYLTEVLDGVDGLRRTAVRPRDVPQAYSIQLPDGQYLVSTEGWGCMQVLINGRPAPDVGPSLRSSRTRLGIRGRMGTPEQGLDHPLNWFVMPDDAQGIEVYRSFSEVPEDHRLDAWEGARPCGLVLVWTRSGW